LYWTLAVIITFAAIIYQRRTGPTYDKKVSATIENVVYNFKLIRSHGGESDCKIQIAVPDPEVTGKMMFKLYPTKNDWTIVDFMREGENLIAFLPKLPPAGKYEYKVSLFKNNTEYALNKSEPVIIRFKGHVPGFVLIPHIIFMFFAMFLGNVAGIMAIFKHSKFRFYGTLTVIFLFIGGMILGPIVQKFAFGEFWAGVPFAWDLTDNKTLISFLFWGLAWVMNRKKERPVYTIVASIVMILVYSIPHSMHGSQLDPETGEIIQGWIRLMLF
jgi:hypothetical protein